MEEKPFDINDLRTFEKMMDYLEEKLSKEEHRQMEHLISEDEAFADDINELHAEWLRNPKLREEVPRLHTEMFSKLRELGPPAVPKPNIRRLLQATVAIAAVLLIFFLLRPVLFPPAQLESVSAIAEQAGIYKQKGNFMSGGGTDSLARNAFELYDKAIKRSDYTEAISSFEQLIDPTSNSQTMREMTLCLAISYIMEGQANSAIPYLKRARSFKEPKYHKEANWYEALALIDLGQKEKAQIVLEQVIIDEGHYAEAARNLKNILSRND